MIIEKAIRLDENDAELIDAFLGSLFESGVFDHLDFAERRVKRLEIKAQASTMLQEIAQKAFNIGLKHGGENR